MFFYQMLQRKEPETLIVSSVSYYSEILNVSELPKLFKFFKTLFDFLPWTHLALSGLN